MMNRFLLLLLLSLAPTPAAASAHAHVPDQITSLVPDLDVGILRSTLGLELVHGLGRRVTGERSEVTSLDLPLRSNGTLPTAWILHGSNPATVADIDALFPRFEHLPYFATAPPFLR